MKKSLVVYSGGLDSTVLLTDVLARDEKGRSEGHSYCNSRVFALHFCYGQKHDERELKAALAVCTMLEVPMQIVSLPFEAWGFKSALLTQGGAVPVGDYNEEDLRETIVPFRNGIMLSIAAGIAMSKGFTKIYIGAHAGDHAIYPDCREDFLSSMQRAVSYGTDDIVGLARPFIGMSKEKIVRLGAKIGAPMELSYSCYNGGKLHCGQCGTCRERRAAFVSAGVDDPTEYETQQE